MLLPSEEPSPSLSSPSRMSKDHSSWSPTSVFQESFSQELARNSELLGASFAEFRLEESLGHAPRRPEVDARYGLASVRLQTAVRKTIVRRWFERVCRAVRYVQRSFRCWLARHRDVARGVVEESRVEFNRTFEANAVPQGHSRLQPISQAAVPRLAFSPRAFSAPRLERGRSGMHTLRMGDDSEAERLRSLSLPASHFDVVARGQTAVEDALYESGKRHFAAGQYERALVDFKLVVYQLQREERRAARLSGRRPRFDPEATGFRNLDDYIDKVKMAIRRRKHRADATAADQRALLGGSATDYANPSVWLRVQLACLSCLHGCEVLAKPAGNIRKDLGISFALGDSADRQRERSNR